MPYHTCKTNHPQVQIKIAAGPATPQFPYFPPPPHICCCRMDNPARQAAERAQTANLYAKLCIPWGGTCRGRPSQASAHPDGCTVAAATAAAAWAAGT
eukprot:1142632-Pelagomonas_calceolata.AAC.2